MAWGVTKLYDAGGRALGEGFLQFSEKTFLNPLFSYLRMPRINQ